MLGYHRGKTGLLNHRYMSATSTDGQRIVDLVDLKQEHQC